MIIYAFPPAADGNSRGRQACDCGEEGRKEGKGNRWKVCNIFGHNRLPQLLENEIRVLRFNLGGKFET
jgi:hypothetical protein